MNSDSEDEELIDEFQVAVGNANAIALEMTKKIAHPTITWRLRNGLTIQELSEDDALTHF